MQIFGGWHIGARVKIEVRTELMPASASDRTLDPEAPDADCLHLVALTIGTVARVYHRTLAVSGRGGPDASGRGKPGFDPYCTRPDTEVPASGQF